MKIGVKIKLAVLLSALFFLTTISMGLMMIANQRASLEELLRAMAGTITHEFASDSKIPLMQKDALAMNLLVQNIMKYPGIHDAYILNDSMHIEAHNELSEVGLGYGNEKGIEGALGVPPWIIREENDVITFASPIIFKDTTVGYTVISFSESFIQERVLQAVKKVTLVAFLAAIGVSLISIPLSSVLLRPVFRLFKGTSEIARGNFDYRIEPMGRDEIGDLVDSFNHMASELKKKEFLKGALNRYVSSHIADEIMKAPEQIRLGGERRDVTVLFVDIRGFTALSRSMAPEETVELLNRYFTVITEVVFRLEGTVDKFIGDGVMCVFGSPISSPAHLEEGVKCAFAVKEAVSEVNRRRLAQGGAPLQIGIGLDTGPAVVGNMGSKARMEFTAVGDCVNMASRLTGLARGEGIVVSSAVYTSVAGHVEADRLDGMEIKGLDNSVTIYSLTGLKGEWAEDAKRAVAGAIDGLERDSIVF